MDKDSDFQFIKTGRGDYFHGRNIRSDTNLGSSYWDQENILGNLYAASLGEVEKTDKTYKIYVNTISASTTWEFTAYDQNGVQIFQVSLNVAATPLFLDYVTAIDALIQAAMPANWIALISNISGSSADSGSFDLTLTNTPYTGMDYLLTVEDIGATPVYSATMLVITEAVDLSMEGFYRVIGSFDLLGELFVWATPITKMPLEIDITQTGNSGGQVIVSTGAVQHNLVGGEVVKIAGTGTTADGIWFASPTSANQFILEGSVFVSGSINLGTATLNVTAYGTIASVTHDVNTDLFTLKHLVRTRNFHFRTKLQIQGEVHKIIIDGDLTQYNFYWVDNDDNPRVMYYIGTFNDDGAIDGLNPLTNPGDVGLYSYDSIGRETILFINSNQAQLTYSGTTQFGGAVKAGNWLYIQRCYTAERSPTVCSYPTNPVNVYAPDEQVSSNQYILGNAPLATTPKRVRLQLTGLEPDLFKYVELIGINLVSPESFTVWSLGLREITGETMEIEHTGLESDAFIMSASELLVQTTNIKSARHIVSLDNILLLGDLKLHEEIDLTEISTQIWHQLKRDEIPMAGFINNYGPAAEFQSTSNVNTKLGMMYNETVRYGIVGVYRNTGIETKAYPLDDIKFDISPVNTPSSAFSAYGSRRGLKIKQITYLIDTPVPGTTTLLIETEGEHGFIIGSTLTIADVTGLAPLVSINAAQTVVQVNTPTQFNVEVVAIVTGTYDAYSGHVTGELPSCQLTNDPLVDPTLNGVTYVFYVEFSHIPWDYILSNGQKVSDVFEAIKIVRCPVIPEVKACGLLLPSLLDPDGVTYIPQRSFSAAGGGLANYTVPLGDIRRQIGFFVSPDLLYNTQNQFAFQSGDKFIMFGTSQARYGEALPKGVNFDNYFEFNGFFSLPTTPVTIDIGNALNTYKGDPGAQITGAGFATAPWALREPSSLDEWDMNMVMVTDGVGTNFFETVLASTGVFFGQYFSPLTDKYGGLTEGLYQSTGHYFRPGPDQGEFINNQKVYGGDTFTQKSYLHIVYKWDPADFGFVGLSFYSQNRVNSQMRWYDSTNPGYLFPAVAPSTGAWVDRSALGPRDQFNYNKSYSQYNLITQIQAYNPNLDTITDLPATTVWSPVKVMGARGDTWRIFLPLDIKNFDLSKGVLNGMWVLNGELYILQQRAFSRLFFNSRGILKTLESEEIILGSGDVLSRDGQVLSTIGCDTKWGAAKGSNQGGNDVLYWLNIEHGKFLRFGADGTRDISSISGMESWFANNTRFLAGKDTPADDEGVHMVWNGRFFELIITVRARMASTEWVIATDYVVGSVVHLEEQPLGTDISFGKTTQLYVSKTIHTSEAVTEPESGEFWEDVWTKIEHSNNNYYNEYTLVFSEKKNMFVCFTSFIPRIYLPWKNRFFSPSPSDLMGDGVISGQDRLFLHNKGEFCEWYKSLLTTLPGPASYTQGSTTVTGTDFLTFFGEPQTFKYTIPIGGVDYYVDSITSDTELELTVAVAAASGTFNEYYISLAEPALIEVVINAEPNLSKIWEAVQMNTEILPFRIEMETLEHETFLTGDNFEYEENYWWANIRMDSTTTGDPTADGSQVFGQWLLIRLYYEPFVSQKLKSLVAKIEQNLISVLQK